MSPIYSSLLPPYFISLFRFLLQRSYGEMTQKESGFSDYPLKGGSVPNYDSRPFTVAVQLLKSDWKGSIDYISIRVVNRLNDAWQVLENGIRPENEVSATQVMLKCEELRHGVFYVLERFGFAKTSFEVSGCESMDEMNEEKCGEMAIEFEVKMKGQDPIVFRSHSVLVFSNCPKKPENFKRILNSPRFGHGYEMKTCEGDVLQKQLVRFLDWMEEKDRVSKKARTFNVDITAATFKNQTHQES
eukprot:TRINITY_DN9101_c0_g1_i4.p1 TRINITY_DN9101_c0_g1~~TRINITY_DN9101_c0_g1_i4.p1  ORF type:complete len:244 (+),score=49.50 TRINITY_DN9101_c0_g1_i4:70-801(+)